MNLSILLHADHGTNSPGKPATEHHLVIMLQRKIIVNKRFRGDSVPVNS